MELEPPPLEKSIDAPTPLLQHVGVVVKEREVVDVAEITLRAQHFLDEVVEGVEVDVGEELAGQVADGKAATSLVRREEVVAREIEQHRLLRVRCVDDGVD